MKITMIILAICALILFVPRYNLYEKESDWAERYLLRDKGYWSLDSCNKAGRQRDNAYKCTKTNTWHDIWGNTPVSME